MGNLFICAINKSGLKNKKIDFHMANFEKVELFKVVILEIELSERSIDQLLEYYATYTPSYCCL